MLPPAKMSTVQCVTGELILDPSIAANVHIELGALEVVRGAVDISGSTTMERLSFPRLRWVEGDLILGSASYPNSAIVALDFPALAYVGQSLISGATPLSTFSLPRLRSVGARLNLFWHSELTSLQLGALEGVKDYVSINGNPKLPACQVKAILDRLAAFGFDPTQTDLAANDDAGLCP